MHYLAEGNARSPFHTWVSLHNPTERPVDVAVALHLDDGTTSTRAVHVPARSCSTLDASQLTGVEGHAFAIDVQADGEVTVLRTMAWDDVSAAAGTGPRLRLVGTWQEATPAGTTCGACLEIENVGDAPAVAEVEQLTTGARVRQTVLVPPHASRAVRSAPARRADVTRVVGTSRYFAGGETGRGAETILTLTNHTSRAATIDVRYLPETQPPALRRHVVAPQARITIVAGEDARFRRPESFGMHVRSVDGVAVDVERSTWWSSTEAGGWDEGHGSDGASARGSLFELPVGGDGLAPVVLMANPGDAPAHVHVLAVAGTGPDQTLADVTIPGGRQQRAHLTLRQLPGGSRPTSIRIVCDDDARIVVERASGPGEFGPGAPCGCVGVPVTRLR